MTDMDLGPKTEKNVESYLEFNITYILLHKSSHFMNFCSQQLFYSYYKSIMHSIIMQ